MDHTLIEEQSLVDRYLQGRLSVGEKTLFEDHFIDCEQCLEQLELAEAFRTGVRDAVAGEAVRNALLPTLLARLLHARRAVAFALVCLLALPVAWWLGRHGAATPLEPQANVPTYTFGASRGEQEDVLTVVAGEWLALEVLTDGGAFPGYRLSLVEDGSTGAILWHQQGLQPDREDLLRVTFPPGFLPPGDLRLDLFGEQAGGGSVPLASHRLRVTDPGHG